MTFKVNDRVRSIGLHSRDYGSGKVIATNRDVATVLFEDVLVQESFHFAMLRESCDCGFGNKSECNQGVCVRSING